jgi:hypothetical protein
MFVYIHMLTELDANTLMALDTRGRLCNYLH